MVRHLHAFGALGAILLGAGTASAAIGDRSPTDVHAVGIAVCGTRASAEAVSRALQADELAPHAIDGWWVVESRIATPGAAALDLARRAAPGAFVSPTQRDQLGGLTFPTANLLVRFADGVARDRAVATLVEETADDLRGDDLETRLDTGWGGLPNTFRLRDAARDGSAVLVLAARLAARPEVRFAEPDMVFSGRGEGIYLPDDPGFPSCWGLHNTGQTGGAPDVDMNAPEAWATTLGDESIVVLIIDVGVEATHPDLIVLPGVDGTSQGPGSGEPVGPCDKHGTPVAGCVSATISNALGTVGAAPGCRVASGRAFIANASCNGSWAGITSWTVAVLDWALSNGVRVTNNSNYYSFTSQAIADKYAQLRDAGIVNFASSGNSGGSNPTYPANLPSVVAVTAIDHVGNIAQFGGGGSATIGADLAAPGKTIFTTDRVGAAGYSGGDYVTVSGTSFSSPYAAGIAALVLSRDPSLSAIEVEARLFETARDLGENGFDVFYGWGLVDAAAAVKATTPPLFGDLNDDGMVGGADLGLLLAAWGPCPGCPADLNQDGVVDGADYGEMLGAWE